jgi:hypothetical protein
VQQRYELRRRSVGFVVKARSKAIRGLPITFNPAIPTRYCFQRTAPVTALEATLRAAAQSGILLWRSDEYA